MIVYSCLTTDSLLCCLTCWKVQTDFAIDCSYTDGLMLYFQVCCTSFLGCASVHYFGTMVWCSYVFGSLFIKLLYVSMWIIAYFMERKKSFEPGDNVKIFIFTWLLLINCYQDGMVHVQFCRKDQSSWLIRMKLEENGTCK